jgi:hypothetical protein
MHSLLGMYALQSCMFLQAGGKQSSFPGASAVQRGLSIFGNGRQSSLPGLQQPFGMRGGSPTASLGPTAEVCNVQTTYRGNLGVTLGPTACFRGIV